MKMTLKKKNLCYSPATYDKLSAINWRLLFSIEPEAPVKIVILPGSDDDSGGASLEISENS